MNVTGLCPHPLTLLPFIPAGQSQRDKGPVPRPGGETSPGRAAQQPGPIPAALRPAGPSTRQRRTQEARPQAARADPRGAGEGRAGEEGGGGAEPGQGAGQGPGGGGGPGPGGAGGQEAGGAAGAGPEEAGGEEEAAADPGGAEETHRGHVPRGPPGEGALRTGGLLTVSTLTLSRDTGRAVYHNA